MHSMDDSARLPTRHNVECFSWGVVCRPGELSFRGLNGTSCINHSTLNLSRQIMGHPNPSIDQYKMPQYALILPCRKVAL